MKKVIIIGCPGSGKSTFARSLHELTGIPLFYLDQMNWNPDKTVVPKPVFTERLLTAMKGDKWIIDGNYGSTMEMQMQVCDTVFFLDYSTDVCLAGIESRRGKERADMPWIEAPGETDEEFVQFIRDYNTVSKPRVLRLLHQYPEKHVIVFQSRADSEAYLERLGQEFSSAKQGH